MDIQKKINICDICIKYPFLIPRDIDGSIVSDFNYEYLCIEIPVGWYRLFFQMCEDIKPLLEEEGILEDFYFIQVKEKYNYMRCYSNGIESKEIEEIIGRYEQMAYYVCTNCGSPATYETQDYFASFCDDCWKDICRHKDVVRINFKPYYKLTGFDNGRYYKRTVSFENEWNKYLSQGELL